MHWWTRRLLRQMGLPGLTSIVFLLLALGIVVVGIFPLQHELSNLRQRLTQQATQPIKIVQVMSPEQVLTDEMAVFEQRFSGVEQLSSQLEILFQLTEKHGLTLDKGQYALVERAAGSLRRFEVTLPVAGGYQQIRALILAVLEKLPAAALSDVTMEREKIADGRLKATLRLVLFVRKST
jgi:hypothetical protein